MRIYFGGGGTDISPYPEEKGGAVLGATINKFVYGTLIPKYGENIQLVSEHHKQSAAFGLKDAPDYGDSLDFIKVVIQAMGIKHGLDLFMRGDLPPESGLGSGSSAVIAAIGLVNYLKTIRTDEMPLNNYEIAELAYKIMKQVSGREQGRQNQYASVFGGLNLIEFKGGSNVTVSPLKLKKDAILELEKNLLLVYVGSRGSEKDASKIIVSQQASYLLKEKIEILGKLKEITYSQHKALLRGDFVHFGELINEAWTNKKKLNPLMTNDWIEKIHATALKAGAIGGRLMGAGGGGHMIFYCDIDKEHVVAKELEKLGAKITSFSFESDGMQTWKLGEF